LKTNFTFLCLFWRHDLLAKKQPKKKEAVAVAMAVEAGGEDDGQGLGEVDLNDF